MITGVFPFPGIAGYRGGYEVLSTYGNCCHCVKAVRPIECNIIGPLSIEDESVSSLKNEVGLPSCELAFIKYFNATMAKPFKWTYGQIPLCLKESLFLPGVERSVHRSCRHRFTRIGQTS